MKFDREVTLVTGAGKGLGKEIARQFATRGAYVLVNDIDRNAAEEVVKQIRDAGGKADLYLSDVSKIGEVEEMVEKIYTTVGAIDILVNNAAVFAEPVPFVEISDEEWDRLMNVNLKGVFNCSKVVAKRMMERKKGCIINLSSFTGKSGRVVYSTFGNPTKAHYSCSKAGILSLTKSLAFELAPFNIRVNAVAPGAVENDTTSSEKRRMLSALVPLGRTGTPAEVASAVLYLASPEASFITGEILDVNGGILMD